VAKEAVGLALLAQERNHILLAEVTAVLHDIGKFCDLHMEAESIGGTRNWSNDHAYKAVVDNPASLIRLRPAAANLSKPDILNNVLNATSPKIADFLPFLLKQALEQIRLNISGEGYTLAELIMLGAPGFATHQNRSRLLDTEIGWLPAVLGICHHEAHYDKPDLPQTVGQQDFPDILASTAFGHESKTFIIGGAKNSLDERLKALPISISTLNSPYSLVRTIIEEFQYGLGDTRRPVNEVDLAIWASSVAALFKAALSGSMLDKRQAGIRNWSSWRDKIIDHDFQWRLLHINFDGLSFVAQAPTIGDLLSRQAALQSALNDVRTLLEVTYPLGNEVYRDENGSAFVVPALDGDDADGNKLRGLIESHILDTFHQSELRGELRPHIHITQADRQAAVLHRALATSPPPLAPFQDALNYWWQGEADDVCTACGMRPQGWGAPSNSQKRKAQERNVCYVCLERRGARAKIWAQARHETGDKHKPWQQTIWSDEVADESGRLALLVGKFDLTQWLNGDLVQTLLVVCDPPNNRYESKNPSFARLQRVWRTTHRFWQAVQDQDIPAVAASLEQHRLAIAVANADQLREGLGEYHVYDAEINGRYLSLVWDTKSSHLLTADNLAAWTNAGAATFCEQLPEKILLYEPGGYGQRRAELVTAQVDKSRSEVFPAPYSPIIPLLMEPTSFMALVPAAIALDAARKIARRYELEMSKVSNRLPLFLGVIFFDRRQPLFSALDAGRRLLKHQLSPVEYTVTDNRPSSRQDAPEHLHHAHFEKWREVKLIPTDGETLRWRASTIMGDGREPDSWYPYVHVLRDKDGNSPTGRQQFCHPEHSGQHWVHVSEVHTGDVISFVPSCFTWLHLDTSARRFEAGTRISPLEELVHITTLWQRLKDLAAANKVSESQWHAVITLLTTKRQMWGGDAQEFIKAVLAKERLHGIAAEDVISGRLQATFELYSQILKQKLKR
jgi:hypothetical protein